MSENIHTGDIGTIFIATIIDSDSGSPIDLSASTARTIIFKRPVGEKINGTASLSTDGTDGKIQYSVVDGDLNMCGDWSIQAKVVGPGYTNYSEISTFTVINNL